MACFIFHQTVKYLQANSQLPYSENMLPAELARYLSQIISGMVEKKNWKTGQSGCCTASSGFRIPPRHTYFCPDLYVENWTVFIHSPVFCFPAKTACNTLRCCQRCWFFMMCVSVCLVVPRLIHLRQRCPNMLHSFNFTKIQAAVPHTILCLIF